MTYREAIISLAAALASVGPTRADTPSFWGRPDLDIRVRFENLDDYPNYDFYLKYGLGRGDPSFSPYLTKVQSGVLTPFQGTGTRLTSVYLVAIPRGQAPPKPGESRHPRDWIQNQLPGTLQSVLLREDRYRLSAGDHGSEFDYHVYLNGDQLKTDLIDSRHPQFRLWMAIAGLVLSASLAAVVIVKRRRTKAIAPTAG